MQRLPAFVKNNDIHITLFSQKQAAICSRQTPAERLPPHASSFQRNKGCFANVYYRQSPDNKQEKELNYIENNTKEINDFGHLRKQFPLAAFGNTLLYGKVKGIDYTDYANSTSGFLKTKILSYDLSDNKSRFVEKGEIAGLKMVAVGANHALLLTIDGKVYAIGKNNSFSQLCFPASYIYSPNKLVPVNGAFWKFKPIQQIYATQNVSILLEDNTNVLWFYGEGFPHYGLKVKFTKELENNKHHDNFKDFSYGVGQDNVKRLFVLNNKNFRVYKVFGQKLIHLDSKDGNFHSITAPINGKVYFFKNLYTYDEKHYVQLFEYDIASKQLTKKYEPFFDLWDSQKLFLPGQFAGYTPELILC